MLTIIFAAVVFVTLVSLPGLAAMSALRLKFERAEQGVFLWAISGSLVLITVWIWVYFLGGSFRDVKRVSIAVWLVALAVTIYLVVRVVKRKNSVSRAFFALPVVALLILITGSFYLVPRTVDGEITQRQYMGPDAIGYANAVAGLLEDGSFEQLRSVAIASSGHGAEYELFDQGIRAVYMIPDKSLSVKTEFITGSLRVGFPGIVALVTDQIGFRHLLTALNVTASLYVVAGALLIFGLMRSRNCGTFTSLAVSVLALVNISLLVGFHEGGVAQAFMFSATAAFLVASIQEDITQRMRLFLYTAAFMQAISSYVDMLFVFVGVSILWRIVAQFNGDTVSKRRSTIALAGVCLGAFALAPLSFRLPRFLFRRLADARQGGWNWESWTELTSLVGLSNPYYSSSPDSIITQVVLIALAIVIVRTWRHRTTLGEVRQLKSFTIALLLFSSLFYVYTRLIMGHSTYQWFKLVGTFLGPASIPLIALFIPWDEVRLRKSSFVTFVTVTFAGTLIALTSLQYVRFFFSESVFVSRLTMNEVADPKVRATTAQYQVFGHYGWQELALTPFWPAQFLNRDDGEVRPIPREDLPVGLLVRQTDCPEWDCLRNVPTKNKIAIGSQYLIVDLEMKGADIRLASPYSQWVRVNRALAKLNAPYVEGNWTDLGPRLRYKD